MLFNPTVMSSRARTPQPDGTPSTHYAPTAEFAQRPPSPPFIHIPSRTSMLDRMQLAAPTEFDGVDVGDLNPQELAIITGNGRMQKSFNNEQWHYELRRQAQPILDFIFLGPSSAARDVDFLLKNNITMVLGARDARLAPVRLAKVEAECQRLGIAVRHIDVGSPYALINSFPTAVNYINRHLVEEYRKKYTAAGSTDANGTMDVDNASQTATGADLGHGKVLVFCETGNDRSAAVVAAYIMAMFRVDMVTAVQFVQTSRFCACFDEETKQMLTTYQDLLQARRQVALQAAATTPSDGRATPIVSRKRGKRAIVDTIDEEDAAMEDVNGTGDMDRERYQGRNFAPFIDMGGS